MARQPGFKRLTRKARHLIRVLRRSKHAVVQDAAIGGLRHEINRKWYRRSRAAGPAASKNPGRWRPLTHRAKSILRQLRMARSLQVQRKLVDALQREVKRGKRVSERLRKAKMLKAARVKARATGRAIRRTVASGQERHLSRAERRQDDRENGKKRPGRIRTWRARRIKRLSHREPYNGPFRSRRAHRRWGRQGARREVPGLFAWFAARRGWTRLQPGHKLTPAARAAQARTQRRSAAPRRAPSASGGRPRRGPQTRAPRSPRTPARTR